MTVIDKLRNYWQAEQFDQLAGSYSSDALLDIHVPAGRMQCRGTQSIIAFWRLDFGRPRQFANTPRHGVRSSKHRSLTRPSSTPNSQARASAERHRSLTTIEHQTRS
jgi:hypothetical protein